MKVTGPIKIAIGVLIYLGVPITLIALPQTFFEIGGNSICLFKYFVGIECYGCGLTRAFQHAIHLDLIGAIEFNQLICIVFPLLIYVWIKGIVQLVNDVILIFRGIC
jgi:hypothetical protein